MSPRGRVLDAGQVLLVAAPTRHGGLINHTPHSRISLYFYFFLCIFFVFFLLLYVLINLALKYGNNFKFASIFSSDSDHYDTVLAFPTEVIPHRRRSTNLRRYAERNVTLTLSRRCKRKENKQNKNKREVPAGRTRRPRCGLYSLALCAELSGERGVRTRRPASARAGPRHAQAGPACRCSGRS